MATYPALFLQDNKFREFENLHNLMLNREPLKIILKRELHKAVPLYSSGTMDLYKHMLVNSSGTYTPIELDNFVIEEIENDDFTGDGSNRGVIIKEKVGDKKLIIKTYTKGWNIKDFLVKTFVNLINDLNQVDSIISYNLLLENRKLKEELDQSNMLIKQISNQLNDYLHK